MITTALYLFWFFLPLQPLHGQVQAQERHEICKGATFFIVHGHTAPWIKNKKLLCRIGVHDFYEDKK